MPRKSPRPKLPTEAQEMAVLAEYLDAKGYLWCHVPNEGRRSPRYGAKLKREGMKRGVPDVLIFAPVRIAIELKRIKGPKATDEQLRWIDLLNKSGWTADVAHGALQAIRFICRATGEEMPLVIEYLKLRFPDEDVGRMKLKPSPFLDMLRARKTSPILRRGP